MRGAADGVVLGLKDVQSRLLDLPRKVGMSVVRRNLYRGAVIIRDEARTLVAVRYGALQKSIAAQTDRLGKERNVIVMRVLVLPNAFRLNEKSGRIKKQKRKKGERRYYRGEIYPRNYAHLVEFGTQPRPQGKGTNPGVRPRPFMRAAFDLRKDEALDTIVRGIRDEVINGAKGGRG
jgi:HK97 gp10 family phage protein